MAGIRRRKAVKWFLCAMLAMACAVCCSPARAQTAQVQDQITQLEQKLAQARADHNQKDVAHLLILIGDLHWQAGEMQKSLDCSTEALTLARELPVRIFEAAALREIGTAYSGLGQEQKALEYFTESLPIWREIGEHGGEAVTLSNIGRVYSDLGQQQQALEFYNQALTDFHAVDSPASRGGEAKTLNNIGLAYYAEGELRRALEYFNRSLPIRRELGDRKGFATTLNNIAVIYYKAGLKQKALEYFIESLSILRELGDPAGEAHLLWEIGSTDNAAGDAGGELRYELAALSLATTVGNPDLQGGIETTLMEYFRDRNQPEEAIFFGINAVNSLQQIRRNISGLDKDLQAGFVQSKSSSYRTLAELLVQTNRLGEAEQVLDLLKEQELKEVVRGAGNDLQARIEPLKLTSAQQQAQSDLAAGEKTAAGLTDLSLEYAKLLAETSRTADKDARLKTLDATIEAGNEAVADFFKKTVYPELAQKTGTVDANTLLHNEKSAVSDLQNTLARLGPDVMGIRLLLGDEHAYAIVVTAHTREKFELKATPAKLRSMVLQVRDKLRTPSSDPNPLLAELYDHVVAPFGDELKAMERSAGAQGKVPTLLWSLDGVLRYLPMAALYDGQSYMVERFNNVLFTPESYGHMAALPDESAGSLRVLAMGLSKSYGGLPALPGVIPELDAVVHDPDVPESHGPMEGKLLPNEHFTLVALKSELGAGKSFPVVHIASHFVEQAGSGDEPYLMLGGESSGQPDGYQLTLSKIEDSTISFHGTQLLTLSACSTAKGDAAKNGMEMDSLGMIAQQKDAQAVLATLWDVNDASTSRLMSDFYARWVSHRADGKAEALRQAQLALLLGQDAAPSNAGKGRGFGSVENPISTTHLTGFSHPFFWAPFVLIGNFE